MKLREHVPWMARVRSLMDRSPLAPVTDVQELGTHRSDHLLAAFTGIAGERWLVKAFAPAAASDYLTEVAIYERFAFDGVVPALRYADPRGLIIATDFVQGGRLGNLDAAKVAAILPRLAPLYAVITDSLPLDKTEGGLLNGRWAVVSHLPSAEGLPEPAVIERILFDVPRHAIHGDFQPSNVLVGERGPLVVDFESYGPGIPATDIARMAYNPVLAIDDASRAALADDMLRALEERGVTRVTPRQFAASTVMWAVSCAAYFQIARTANPQSEITAPEVVPLSTRPLEIAAALWNRGI